MYKNFFITAWRNLVKSRSSSFLNITGLAIGVTVCLLIGVWLQRELTFDNFHPNGDKIFRLSNTFKSESESFSQAPSGPAFGAHLAQHSPAVKATCRLYRQSYKVTYDNVNFIESNALAVDSNFFDFFGFKLNKGVPKQVLNSFDKVVLSQNLAHKYFGNSNAVGKTILLDGEFPMKVTGVAENPPINSQIQFDLLLPSAFLRKLIKERGHFDMDEMWVGGWPYVYVQLDDAVGRNQAEQQINQIAAKFSKKDWEENKMSYHYFLQPLRDIHLKSTLRYDFGNNGNASSVSIFSIVGIIVLLLACINYINLTTAAAIRRAKETSVRKVVGATKIQLVRQFFFETLITCTIAVLLGVLMFKIVLPSFSQWIGQSYHFPFTATNVFIIFGFIVFISTIAGIYPASILSSFNPVVALKGVFLQSTRGTVVRKALVVIQFTITIALITSIVIISQQMNYIKNKPVGFNGNAVVEVDFQGDKDVIEHFASIKNDLLQNAHIKNISQHSQNVVGGLGNGWTTTENLKGEEISTSLYGFAVDENYLPTYDLKLAAGRFFSKDIATDSTKAVLVNEAAVRTFGWQKPENAIGKRFGKGDDTKYVIGVLKDFNFESLHKPVEALRIGYTKEGDKLSLKIDAAHIDEAISHLKKTWKEIVPEVPLQYAFVNESIAKQYGSEQKMEGIFYGFSALSLLIACFGLFGLTTFIVERKVKEIGIRKVLGASVSGIVGLLSVDFVKLIILSILIASPISLFFMSKWLQNFSYHINISWWVFPVAGLTALLVALITVSIQAIRAAIANPVKSLRTE